MICPDVNILVYAHRSDERCSKPYQEWLNNVINDDQAFALSSLVAVAFVRIVTNQKIYTNPTPLASALAVVDTMLTHQNCKFITPGPRHWPILSKLCRNSNPRSKLVADAQHAAVALEHGCTWVSRDNDFRHFTQAGLRFEHLVL